MDETNENEEESADDDVGRPVDLPIERIQRTPADTPGGLDYCTAVLSDKSQWYVKPDDSPGGESMRRELAVWRILCALGWREIGVEVMLRRVVLPNESEPRSCSLSRLEEDFDETTQVPDHRELNTARAAALDYLTKETDRHLKNFGKSPQRDLILIDHEKCFKPALVPGDSVFVARWKNKNLPDQVIGELRDHENDDWAAILDELVGTTHRENFVARLKALCSDGSLRA